MSVRSLTYEGGGSKIYDDEGDEGRWGVPTQDVPCIGSMHNINMCKAMG